MTHKQTSIEPKTTKAWGLKGRLRNSASLVGEWRRFQKAEDGSMIVFTLFIFIMMLLVGGMAVDLMRFETKRAKLQNTLDSATLAATNMNSTADPTQLVKDFMAKNGYDATKVNVTPDEVRIGADPANNDPGRLAARSVSANYDLNMNTIFMHMMGIDSLGTGTSGGAAEGIQSVEISLVLDISGSMNGQKLTDLQNAAESFFLQVIDPQRTEAVTSISVIPYNHTTVVPDSLLSRLNVNDTVPIPPVDQARYDSNGNGAMAGQPIPGALTQYQRTASGSKCVRFPDSQMTTANLEENLPPAQNPNYLALRSITASTVLDKMQYYDRSNKSLGSGSSYDRPGDDWNRRCDPTRGAILPLETNQTTLINYVKGLTAGGNTAVDVGLKWGVALLDPGFRPIIQNMVDATPAELPTSVEGRPFDYDPAATMKVLVLMTDGMNTTQYDVNTAYKNGPSRIWFSEEASKEVGPNGEDWSNKYVVDNKDGYGNWGSDGVKDRNKEWYDGYYVLMNPGTANEYWLRPHKPEDSNSGKRDGARYEINELPNDAVQKEYTELYDKFSEYALAELFRDIPHGDWTARNEHRVAEIGVVSGTDANRRMNGTGSTEYGMCDVAKVNNDILVFTIAFQVAANSTAETVMKECASGVDGAGYYFPASNAAALTNAFSAIAGQITKLRLTQ